MCAQGLFFDEPARRIPLVQETDVIVCGAGPAGVAAAISAARAGARTRLIEVHGCLGGVWTAGMLAWVVDMEKVDVHSLDPSVDKGLSNMGVRAVPYDIPLRALIARDMGGLLMAGRCISGDFIAHASYRVTGNAVAMGQAAGTVAALSALGDRLPHEVSWEDV